MLQNDFQMNCVYWQQFSKVISTYAGIPLYNVFVCVLQSGEIRPIRASEQLSPMRMSISYPIIMILLSLPLSVFLSLNPTSRGRWLDTIVLALLEVSACKRQFVCFLPLLLSACSWEKCWVSVNKLIKKYGLDLLNLEGVMRWLLLRFDLLPVKLSFFSPDTVWNVSAAGIKLRKGIYLHRSIKLR